MDRTTRKKINKETQNLKNTIDQLNLRDMYRPFHPTAGEYTFSYVHLIASYEAGKAELIIISLLEMM